jgi:hypothetical protein
MVSMAVTPDVPLTFTGVVVPKLTVGGYWAPAGLDVTFALRETLPVNPPCGVTVIVDMFPVVIPGELMVTFAAPTVKEAGTAVIVTVPVALAAV